MTTVSRLDSKFPQLAESFRQATISKQRKAAVTACLIAVKRTGLEEGEVNAAIDILRSEELVSASLQKRLESLAALLDDEYFRLNEAGDESALDIFSKARAAAALSAILSGDPRQLHEAIYEAIAALDDPEEIVNSVENALH